MAAIHQDLFHKHVSIDPQTGQGMFSLPIANLYADEGLCTPYKLSLFCMLDSPHLQLIPSGTCVEKSHGAFVEGLPLSDGRLISEELAWEDNDCGDLGITYTRHKHEIAVSHKGGDKEVFSIFGEGTADVVLTRLTLAGGKFLKLKWSYDRKVHDREDSCVRLTSIDAGDRCLFKVKGEQSSRVVARVLINGERERVLKDMQTFEEFVLFPDTPEQVTYTFKETERAGLDPIIDIEVEGGGVLGKTVYRLETTDKKLSKIDVSREHSIPGAKEGDATVVECFTHTETLLFADDNVSQYSISPGAGVDALVETYEYADDKTTITCRQVKAGDDVAKGTVLSVRECHFKDGRQVSESVVANGVNVTQEQHITLDKNRLVAAVKSTRKVDGVTVDEETLEYDPSGNLVSRTQSGTVTEWTYYNNYKSYRVEEKAKRFEDTSFFGLIFKAFDYLNPIGWALRGFASKGFTWGTVIDSEVTMSHAANNYAKEAFQLPVDANYPGDEGGGCKHVESEFVYRKDGEKKLALSLTYYGYVTLGTRVVPAQKLTVLQPSYEEIDVSSQQLKVANAAAKELLDSLKKQNATDDLADLEKSLLAQSKENARGFKLLKPWVDGGMLLETLAYQSDEKKPGYGMVTQKTRRQLDANGLPKDVDGVVSTFDYRLEGSQDDGDQALCIDTSVTGRRSATVTSPALHSSQHRSIYTGRPQTTKDSDGIETAYRYDEQGMLAAREVTLPDGTRTDRLYQWSVLKGGLYQCETHSTESTRRTRVIKDVLGRERERWVSPDGTVWLKTNSATYHPSGRLASRCEYDYDSSHKACMTRETLCSDADSQSSRTITHVLKDAEGKELDRKSQTLAVTADGETLTQGSFQVQRRYGEHGALSETFGAPGKDRLQIDRTCSGTGQLESVSYSRLDKDGKQTELDKLAFSYDAFGQLETLTPTFGGASAYTYDVVGRVLTSTTDGVEISKRYTNVTSSAVDIYLKVIGSEDDPLMVGGQDADGLGKVYSQRVWGQVKEFGASTATAEGEDEAEGEDVASPPTLEGYESDSTGFSSSERIVVAQGTCESISRYSLRGNLLGFEGLEGGLTSYQYDALGRITLSSNAGCESTFAYTDSGLLASETIKALNPDVSMTVTYQYNESGQEISRSFACDGLDTHVIERTLLGDGRLQKSSLKVKGKITRSDSYDYDGLKRLESWSCSGPGVSDGEGQRCVRQVFTYGPLGNVLSRADDRYSGDSRPDACTTRTLDYSYAKLEELTASNSGATEHDPLGFVTRQADRRFTYHGNGQVKSCAVEGEKDYVFAYDDRGRIRGAHQGEWSEHYHYRHERIYALVQRDGESSHGFSERRFVLLNDSPSCYLQERVVLNGAGDPCRSRSFELRDAAGSIFASVDLSNKQVTHFTYTPYGYREADPRAVTWLGFKGEPLNALGLYHLGLGYRLYDPQLQRFQAADSWSPFGAGGLSRFSYCDADPVNNHDFNGHQVIAQYSRYGGTPLIHSREFGVVMTGLGAMMAPLTAGSSLAFSIAVTGVSAASFYFDLASIILQHSDPKLSKALSTAGLAFGIAGIAAGVIKPVAGLAAHAVSHGSNSIARAAQSLSKNSLLLSGRYMRLQTSVIGKSALGATQRWQHAAKASNHLYAGASRVSQRAHSTFMKLLLEKASTSQLAVSLSDDALRYWTQIQDFQVLASTDTFSHSMGGEGDFDETVDLEEFDDEDPFEYPEIEPVPVHR
ncbi:RHS repeat-associated core domain-containing protein [Pseudomonas sp. Marseille-P9899]|uniref:RHS repeat-associated core domain-containing protein n=1 Tax=Pseudomonas sp. Marseille-P9899 TaxID=2730401 RepID=UPI00158B9618|nr:RHS repeat-associated core domain-containing protein [Pseudomonas sp. Marseille-P9899]